MTIGRIPSVEGGIQPTIVDAKGDILTATAADTPAVLAVGNNGDTLVADSSATTGLRWGANYGFTAGKNKIINGDFYINQRGFTSNTTTTTFNFDRWRQLNSGGTVTVTPQTFTLGAAPVSGYEGKTFVRFVTSGQSAASDRSNLQQLIESVRTFAGQTVTVSFWAKAGAGTPKIAVEFQQSFGSGGSPSSAVNAYAGQSTISTSWTRYSLTVAIPSISGKTLGTANDDSLILQFWLSAGSDFNSRTGSLGIQNETIDIWGVQVEAGSVATAFQTATGTLAGELAACQRYYVRLGAKDGGTTSAYDVLAQGSAASTGAVGAWTRLPVSMRVTPTSIDYANIAAYDNVTVTGTPDSVVIVSAESGRDYAKIAFSKTASFTQYRPYVISNNNNTAGYLGFSAEL